MNEKPCVRCERAIDAWAGTCPFCNWDQTAAPPAPEEEPPSPAASYKPPDELNLKRKALMVAAAVLLLVASFGIGVVINREDAPDKAPEPLEQQAAEHNAENAVSKPKRANTPLVPAGAGGIEQPITSAPAATPSADGSPLDGSEYDRTDATAVSAAEYAEMAKRAQAEKERMAAVADPRSITGRAYEQAPPQPRPTPRRASAPEPAESPTRTADARDAAPAARRGRGAVRTRPVAQYQPLPQIRAQGTARLMLVIGAGGEVQRVSIEQPLRNGNTAALVSAVQRWRFKPATENGEPVASPYSVEISFRQ